MFTSTLAGANAVRRRVRSSQRALPAALPMRVAASRLPPQTRRALDDIRGMRAHALALVVLAVHGAIALQAWRMSVQRLEATAPRVLDLQFDAGAAATPPVIASPITPRLVSPHRKSAPTAPGNIANASPSKPLVKAAPNNASKRLSAPATATDTATDAATPPPASKEAAREPLDTSAAKSQDTASAPEPVTEPSFGAAYLRNPPPNYPAVAQQRGWQGTVLLKVHVLASGRPDQVGLVSSSGHDSLDDAAIEAVTNWRFAPARRGDQAIDGWVQVPIAFKLGT